LWEILRGIYGVFTGECGELSTLVDNYGIAKVLKESYLSLFWGLFIYKKM
jgi:hypothetical protein